MRMVNSGARLQFILRGTDDFAFIIQVADESDDLIVLDVIGALDPPVSEERFQDECAAWLNARSNEELARLREEARAKCRHRLGTYAGTTDFGVVAEAKLDQIAQISGRWDVYLGHRPATAKIEGWFVFGPWLRDFCRERFYQKPNRASAIEFIDAAHAKVTANQEQARAYRSNTTAEGAAWVADREAKRMGKTFRRVVDVGSIGNGGHVVTWEDTDGVFHTEDDYNNISFI